MSTATTTTDGYGQDTDARPGSTVLDTAVWLLERGLWPVLISPIDSKTTPNPGKAPIGKAWGNERHDAQWWATSLNRHRNAGIGLKLGSEGGVIDIDVDDPSLAAPVLARMFPEGIPETMGWTNAGGRFHLLFRWDDRFARYGKAIIKGESRGGKLIGNLNYLGLEIRIGAANARGKQYQSVVPPSLMANGTARKWSGRWEILPAPESLFRDLDAHATPEALIEAKRKAEATRATTLPSSSARPGGGTAISVGDRLARARKYLEGCDPAISGQGGHSQTFKVVNNVVHGFGLSHDEAFVLLWENYNPRCQPPWSDSELRHKIDDAFKEEPRRGSMLDASPARSNGRISHGHDGASTPIPPSGGGNAPGQAEGLEPPVNEAPDDPHRLARAVLAEFTHREGHTLAWYREGFYIWDNAAYRPDPAFNNRLVALIKAEADRQNREALRTFREQAERDAMSPQPGRPASPPKAIKVTRRLVADVVQALASLACVDQEPDAPFWIRPANGDPDPMKTMPAANGLVDLTGDRPALRIHSPRFFSTFALPYKFEPNAPEPTAWLAFLHSLWPDDLASIHELQKWFGYVLTPDIDHQKILLLIGPPRSGRSTIKDVMSAVVGRRNVASTSAVALADRFGLEPLVGKSLAILGDARTGDTHDAAIMMDRLLRISGGDPVEVNRKGRPILHEVLMRARLVIISNEVPNLRDASKAIVARYLPICTPNSFEGREDVHLKKKLLPELSGILNWAIDGLAMLRKDGRFNPPATAEDIIDDARGLASPVAEFVADRCELAPDAEATINELWLAWQKWTSENGHQAGHRHLFGRNLRASTGYKLKDKRPNKGGARNRIYLGIGLKMEGPY